VPLEEVGLPSSSRHTKILKVNFLKFRASTGDLTLLDEFSLYWTPEPTLKSARRLENLSPKDQGICEFLTSLKVVFDTSFLLTKEYLPGALKAYTNTPRFLPLIKTSTSLSLIIYMFSLQREVVQHQQGGAI